MEFRRVLFRSIDLCRCGRYFQRVDGGVTMAHSVREWCRWVSVRLMSLEQHPRQLPLQEAIPRVLNEVSLDAAFRLVEAFGLLRRADESIHAANPRRQSCESIGNAIARGLERLTLLENDPSAAERLAPLIHLAGLERLNTRAKTIEDRRCASLMLERLCSGRKFNTNFRGQSAGRQLTLFP